MAKQRNSFIVTVTTDGPTKVKHVADFIREALYEAECENVVKVTVVPVGEK